MSGTNKTIQTIDATRFQRKTKDEAGKLTSNLEDFQVTETELDEWVGVDEVRATKEAQAYVNEYASYTRMNHVVAYEDYQNGATVSLTEPDGSIRDYVAKNIEVKDAPGIKGCIFTPAKTLPGETPTVKVAFRGTTSIEDGICNAEEDGAAAVSFALNRERIVSQVNAALAGFAKVNVVIGGHSKGAALAALTTAAIREAAAENAGFAARNSIAEDNRKHFSNMQELTVTGNQGTGISLDTANHNATVVAFLAKQRHADGNPKLTLKNRRLRLDGDGVAQTGQTELDAGVPPEHVDVDVMKVHGTKRPTMSLPTAVATVAGGAAATLLTGGLAPVAAAGAAVLTDVVLSGRNAVKQHTTNIFDPNNSAAIYSFERLSNTKQPDVVKTELNKKSSWLNRIQSGVFAVKDGVASVLSGATGIFGKLGSPFSRSKQAESAPAVLESAAPISPAAKRSTLVAGA